MIPNIFNNLVQLKCVYDNCHENAKWGRDWVPMYCDTHKIEGLQVAFIENTCVKCKKLNIVDKEYTCKKCKIPEIVKVTNVDILYPTHPQFTIRNPSLRSTRSEYDMKPKQLRATRSSPSILVRPDDKLPTINLKSSLIKIQTQSELQAAITEAKEKLRIAKATLSMFSITDNSSSKLLANELYHQAERDVENACKAWCHSNRK